MLRNKAGQQNTAVPETAAVSAADKGGKGTGTFRSILLKKGVATIAAMSLLVALVIFGTLAWYTRIADVTGISLRAAQFDFNANYSNTDFVINVSDYLNVEEPYAAPGTGGVIPIRVSAENSQTAVSYTLDFDFGSVDEKFKERICYYYYKEDENGEAERVFIQPYADSNEIKGTLSADSGGVIYEYIYWKWIYEPGMEEGELSFSNNQWSVLDENRSVDTTNHDKFDTLIGLGKFNLAYPTGNVNISTVYDALYGLEPEEVKAKLESLRYNIIEADALEEGEALDGTEGRLYAYQNAMKLKLNIIGAQAEPEQKTEANTTGVTTRGVTKYVENG